MDRMPDTRRRARWSAPTKVVIVVVMLVLGAFLLSRFSLVITPLVLAVILAYVVSPAVGIVERRTRWSRVWATGAVYVLLLASVALVPVVIIPILVDQFQQLNFDLRLVSRAFEGLPRRVIVVGGQGVSLGPLFEQLDTAWRGLADSFLQGTLSLVVDVVSSLVWTVFILVVSFYLVKDSERLRQWSEKLAPPMLRDDFRRLRDEIGLVWAAFFRGQITLAFVVAILFTAVGAAIGLPFALALGLLAGVLEFLPSLGHGIWFVIGVAVALVQGSRWLPIPSWAFALLVAALHVVFQQADLNLLIPRIIGRRVQLPPLVVVLGIVTGAALAGVLGVALAAPTIASARILGRYVYANLLDEDPFPLPTEASGAVPDRAPEPLPASSES